MAPLGSPRVSIAFGAITLWAFAVNVLTLDKAFTETRDDVALLGFMLLAAAVQSLSGFIGGLTVLLHVPGQIGWGRRALVVGVAMLFWALGAGGVVGFIVLAMMHDK